MCSVVSQWTNCFRKPMFQICVCTCVFSFRAQLCVRSSCCHYADNGNTATDRNSQLAPGAIAVTASYRTARPKGMN